MAVEGHHIAIETRKVPLPRSYRCISEVRISNSHSLGQKVFLSAGKRSPVYTGANVIADRLRAQKTWSRCSLPGKNKTFYSSPKHLDNF